MTKEDFDAEVYEYAKSRIDTEDSRMTDRMLAYRAGAEPRDKRIKELEKENAELKEQNRNYEQLIDKGSVTLVKERLKNYKQNTKAKELLNKAVLTIEELEGGYDESKWVRGENFCEKVKQFLKEIEKNE